MSATLLEWALFTSGGRPESYGLGDAEEIPTDGPFKIYLSDAYFLYLHKHSRAVPGTQSRTAAVVFWNSKREGPESQSRQARLFNGADLLT